MSFSLASSERDPVVLSATKFYIDRHKLNFLCAFIFCVRSFCSIYFLLWSKWLKPISNSYQIYSCLIPSFFLDLIVNFLIQSSSVFLHLFKILSRFLKSTSFVCPVTLPWLFASSIHFSVLLRLIKVFLILASFCSIEKNGYVDVGRRWLGNEQKRS